jgi:hypothetical protein
MPKVLHNILESFVMFSSRRLREAGQEHGSIANVQMAHNIGIDDLTDYLAIAVANLRLKGAVFLCAFQRTLKSRKQLARVGR